jgi:hypothetical protein
MTIVQYEDFPKLSDQLLDEVEQTGVMVEVIRNGKPYVRMGPANASSCGDGQMVRES